MQLKEKTAMITGAAQGIGKEIALTLAREGANLAICDVNKDGITETQKEIESAGVKVLSFVVDVTDAKQVEDMVNKVLDNLGKVDILVNNAGITRDSLILRMKEADWDAVLAVNLKGAFNCIKAVARPMVKQHSGKIVNIASIIGIMGNPGQANYATSKAGIIGLTKTAAKELASRGINVNAIAPGFIKTTMTDNLTEEQKQKMFGAIPLAKFGETKDVANLVLFLASEASSYITGEVIKIDGGMAM
ncbi:MAG: 3-oxoacyl-[acyl-carrier-protein] reductase [Candidatus Omnitrophota bacterium]|nr:MAG: 3-oxoacyl-[acyl-carrier-protein] reductase [Candidatus Omnitrophota bacterium]